MKERKEHPPLLFCSSTCLGQHCNTSPIRSGVLCIAMALMTAVSGGGSINNHIKYTQYNVCILEKENVKPTVESLLI